MKFTDIKLKYSCPASCPKGIYLDRIYRLNEDVKGLYFTDGNYSEYANKEYIQMLFTPIECNWNEVEYKKRDKED